MLILKPVGLEMRKTKLDREDNSFYIHPLKSMAIVSPNVRKKKFSIANFYLKSSQLVSIGNFTVYFTNLAILYLIPEMYWKAHSRKVGMLFEPSFCGNQVRAGMSGSILHPYSTENVPHGFTRCFKWSLSKSMQIHCLPFPTRNYVKEECSVGRVIIQKNFKTHQHFHL